MRPDEDDHQSFVTSLRRPCWRFRATGHHAQTVRCAGPLHRPIVPKRSAKECPRERPLRASRPIPAGATTRPEVLRCPCSESRLAAPNRADDGSLPYHPCQNTQWPLKVTGGSLYIWATSGPILVIRTDQFHAQFSITDSGSFRIPNFLASVPRTDLDADQAGGQECRLLLRWQSERLGPEHEHRPKSTVALRL